MWYIKYFWVKLNIYILKPLVFIEKKYEEYKKLRLRTYIQYICVIDNIK